jgi:intracellular sulfur oxidation DsrE/DsrF family protein
MKINKLFFAAAFVFFTANAFCQATNTSSTYHGADAKLKSYKALFILDDSDPKKMEMILHNIENSLDDPRLKGKLQVELIAFGPGVKLYLKTSHMDTMLLPLVKRGVIFAECENTMKMAKLTPDQLWPFVSYVPSGNGEIIIRESQGWVGIHP